MKTLPKKIFVKIEGAGEDRYLAASPGLYGLVDMGGTAKIGVYQLVETVEAEAIIQTKKAR